MKKLLALVLLSPLAYSEIYYFKCMVMSGTAYDMIKIDTDKKQFIHDKKYLTDYEENELEIVAYDKNALNTDKYILDKLDGKLEHRMQVLFPVRSKSEFYWCKKTKPFM